MFDQDKQTLETTLVQLIRDHLIKTREAIVPGLGTFKVDRSPSKIEENGEGQIVMKPPREEVIFFPEES